jgi:3-hydroxybutyryl-CoA dehydrogenase
MFARIV